MRGKTKIGGMGLLGILCVCVLTTCFLNTTVAEDPTYELGTVTLTGSEGCGCLPSLAHEYSAAWAWNTVSFEYTPFIQFSGIPGQYTDFVAIVAVDDDNTDGIHQIDIEIQAFLTVDLYSGYDKTGYINSDNVNASDSYSVPAGQSYQNNSLIVLTMDPYLPPPQGWPDAVYADFHLTVDIHWECHSTKQGATLNFDKDHGYDDSEIFAYLSY